MSGYIGTQPVPQATQTRDSFTATSGQTSFATGGYTPNFLDVYLNGVKLASADYTATNGSDVVLASGAATGDILEVVAYTAFDTANVTGATNFTVTGAFTSQGIDDNGNATALTIDSSEKVLIGKTSANIATVGHEINGNGGYASHTRSGNTCLFLNRTTSDGDIAVFRKDGTSVGSVGIQGTGFYIDGEAEHAGIRFGGSAVVPRHNNADSNNYVNLGDSSTRFKDAYLSGGVYLGGTGSANKLDDYEEGTWTPTAVSGVTSFSIQSATYTKVGRMVSVMFYIANQIGNSSASLQIGGLPFAPSNNHYSTGSVECNTAGQMGIVRTNSSNTYLSFFYPNTSTSVRVTMNGNDAGSSHIIGSITYQTA